MSNKIYKPKPVSGFPEWLPEYRAVEMEWMDKIRTVFERYGFCSIETPSVEEIDVLLAKGGETEKEIYTLTRLQADDGKSKDARLALHFDLTVPFARYTAQHFNDLVFPFKRYQIQKSWRGERPQKGRFREFYQCDIDVIAVDTLPIHFDAELPVAMYEAYQALDIPEIELRMSNRKIVFGLLDFLGVDEQAVATMHVLDKLAKIGADKARVQLTEEMGLSVSVVDRLLAVTKIKSNKPAEIAAAFTDAEKENATLKEGLDELCFVLAQCLENGAGFVGDLSIIRGLDYYTGTILESYLKDYPEIGSVGSGGRYEDLAGSFINKKLPGIGVSLGLTRLFSVLLEEGLLKPGKKSPTQVMVTFPSENKYTEAASIARGLRQKGYNVEMYHASAKTKKQLVWAEKKGIDWVWLTPVEGEDAHEVKDMANGEQFPVELSKVQDFKRGDTLCFRSAKI